MFRVIVSDSIPREQHEAITALLRERLAELTQERDFYRSRVSRERYDEVARERDFYREQWTRALGKPLAAEPTVRDVVQAAAETRVDDLQTQIENLRAGWTNEDHIMFADEASLRPETSISAEEWWIKRYGMKRPSEVLLIG